MQPNQCRFCCVLICTSAIVLNVFGTDALSTTSSLSKLMNIIAIGDSITFGECGAPARTSTETTPRFIAYPDYLQSRLDQAKVTNFGVSGNTAASFIRRTVTSIRVVPVCKFDVDVKYCTSDPVQLPSLPCRRRQLPKTAHHNQL